MTTLVNGQFQDSLPVSDRGLQYGDGIWETILISSGRLILLDEHLNRLQWGCHSLKITGLNEAALHQEIQLISKDVSHSILKIIITRGSGGRGYSAQGLNSPTRILSLHKPPETIDYYRNSGINIQYCTTQLSHNPQLSGFKTLNCLEQVLACSELTDDHQEGLVSDVHGNIIEGTMSNLFLIVGEQVITPLLTQCGVQGIMRAYIISLLLNENIELVERCVSKQDISDADRIFFTNSVIGLWFVTKINSIEISTCKENHDCKIISILKNSISKLESNHQKLN
jgi:4-amino-4-deoxychorismate lyase